jgi:hypothetical protein
MEALLYTLFLAADVSGASFLAPEKDFVSGGRTHLPILAQQSEPYFEPPGDLPYDPESTGGDIKLKREQMPEEALLPGNSQGLYVVVPSDWESRDLSLKNGCWAQVYDEDGLSGDALTILGPIDIPDVGGSGVYDIKWKDRISSIETGKRAQMIIYDNISLEDPLVTIGPGQKANINNAIRRFGEIGSLKINCID